MAPTAEPAERGAWETRGLRRVVLTTGVALAAIALLVCAVPAAASDSAYGTSTPTSSAPDPESTVLPQDPPPEPEPEPDEPVEPEQPAEETTTPNEPSTPLDPSPEPSDEVGVDDAPAMLPGLPPAATRSSVSPAMIGIAVAVLVVSAVVLALIVRRRPPQPLPVGVRQSTRMSETPRETLQALATVGEAMIDSGYPSNLVRDALEDIASANQHPDAEIVVFPTALVISLTTGGASLTRAVSTGHQAYLLHQLDGIDRAVRTARATSGSAGWVRAEISRLGSLPAPFTRAQRIAAYVLVSAAISVLLGASWLGVLLAGILGAGVGVLLLLGERVASNYRVLVTVAASLGVSLVVFTVARTALDPGVLPSLVAPLVILLPGGLLTTAVIELATGHIMSGAARAAAGAMRLLLLAVGIVAAGALIGVPSVQLDSAAEPLGPIAPWVAVAVFGVGIAINQCARPGSIGWIVLVLYVAYGAQVLGDVFFGGVLSAMVGAVVVTPVAVIVARQLAGPPAIVSFLPAFWLLVPGALGLVGVTAVLDGDSTGASTIVTTIATMIAIALGVLIGLASTSKLRNRDRRTPSVL